MSWETSSWRAACRAKNTWGKRLVGTVLMLFSMASTSRTSLFIYAVPGNRHAIIAARRCRDSERRFKIVQPTSNNILSLNTRPLLHKQKVRREWFELDLCAVLLFPLEESVSNRKPAVVRGEWAQKCRNEIEKLPPADAEQPASAHRRFQFRRHVQQ